MLPLKKTLTLEDVQVPTVNVVGAADNQYTPYVAVATTTSSDKISSSSHTNAAAATATVGSSDGETRMIFWMG